MSKQEFLMELKKGLSGLPQDDIEERLAFYGEMIDDRMEEGIAEDTAVCEIGPVKNIVSQVMRETSLSKLIKERAKPRHSLKIWEITFLILGSPIWLSLLLAAILILLSVYLVIWSLVVALWSVEIAVAVAALGSVINIVIFIIQSKLLLGAAMFGAGLVCAGIFILLFFGCKALTAGILTLSKQILSFLKFLIIGKGGVYHEQEI